MSGNDKPDGSDKKDGKSNHPLFCESCDEPHSQDELGHVHVNLSEETMDVDDDDSENSQSEANPQQENQIPMKQEQIQAETQVQNQVQAQAGQHLPVFKDAHVSHIMSNLINGPSQVKRSEISCPDSKENLRRYQSSDHWLSKSMLDDDYDTETMRGDNLSNPNLSNLAKIPSFSVAPQGPALKTLFSKTEATAPDNKSHKKEKKKKKNKKGKASNEKKAVTPTVTPGLLMKTLSNDVHIPEKTKSTVNQMSKEFFQYKENKDTLKFGPDKSFLDVTGSKSTEEKDPALKDGELKKVNVGKLTIKGDVLQTITGRKPVKQVKKEGEKITRPGKRKKKDESEMNEQAGGDKKRRKASDVTSGIEKNEKSPGTKRKRKNDKVGQEETGAPEKRRKQNPATTATRRNNVKAGVTNKKEERKNLLKQKETGKKLPNKQPTKPKNAQTKAEATSPFREKLKLTRKDSPLPGRNTPTKNRKRKKQGIEQSNVPNKQTKANTGRRQTKLNNRQTEKVTGAKSENKIREKAFDMGFRDLRRNVSASAANNGLLMLKTRTAPLKTKKKSNQKDTANDHSNVNGNGQQGGGSDGDPPQIEAMRGGKSNRHRTYPYKGGRHQHASVEKLIKSKHHAKNESCAFFRAHSMHHFEKYHSDRLEKIKKILQKRGVLLNKTSERKSAREKHGRGEPLSIEVMRGGSKRSLNLRHTHSIEILRGANTVLSFATGKNTAAKSNGSDKESNDGSSSSSDSQSDSQSVNADRKKSVQSKMSEGKKSLKLVNLQLGPSREQKETPPPSPKPQVPAKSTVTMTSLFRVKPKQEKVENKPKTDTENGNGKSKLNMLLNKKPDNKGNDKLRTDQKMTSMFFKNMGNKPANSQTQTNAKNQKKKGDGKPNPQMKLGVFRSVIAPAVSTPPSPEKKRAAKKGGRNAVKKELTPLVPPKKPPVRRKKKMVGGEPASDPCPESKEPNKPNRRRKGNAKLQPPSCSSSCSHQGYSDCGMNQQVQTKRKRGRQPKLKQNEQMKQHGQQQYGRYPHVCQSYNSQESHCECCEKAALANQPGLKRKRGNIRAPPAQTQTKAQMNRKMPLKSSVSCKSNQGYFSACEDFRTASGEITQPPQKQESGEVKSVKADAVKSVLDTKTVKSLKLSVMSQKSAEDDDDDDSSSSSSSSSEASDK